MSRRLRRIRKGHLPPSEVGTEGGELDDGEKVFSRSVNPRFGDEATRFERRRFVT